MPRCRKVVLKCDEKPCYLPIGSEVSTGTSIDKCTVSISIPARCVIDVSTGIVFSKMYVYRIDEDDENVYIEESLNGRVRELYVYPRDIWKKVLKFYVEPLLMGQPVNEHLLLIGAPGTGKSIMIRLIGNMLGLNVEYIRVSEIRSKFYGESEKNLDRKLRDALSSEPCIIGIDDAEFILTSRSFVGNFAFGAETIEMALRNIMFEYLEKIIKENRRVLVVATTNFSPSAIDEALIRGGRFGEPVFIYLPNYSALYRYAMFLLNDESRARELAYKCVSRGLTIADLKTMVKYMKAGLEPDFKRVSGRGYSRLYSDMVHEIVESKKLRDELTKLYDLDKDRPTTLYMDSPASVAVPIVTQLLMCLKRVGLMLTDPTYIDEYVYTLETVKGVGVVPTSLPEQAQIYVRNNSRQPIIYVGRSPPVLESFSWFIGVEGIVRMLGDSYAPVIKSVLEYYKIRYTTDDLRVAERVVRSKGVKLVDMLTTIVSCGRVSEDIVGRMIVR